MKNKIKFFAALLILIFSATALAACTQGKSNTLGEPAAMSYPEYSEFSGEGYKALNRSAKTFSFDLAAEVFESEDRNDNFAISPISVYAALALAAECAGGETRDQIVSALNTTYDALYQNYGLLIRSLQREFDTGKLTLYNSVWLDGKVPFRQSAVNTLSEKYYCYSYSADFAGDNDNANKAIRYHIKKQTNGLIDRDFDLSTETLFTLISTLYLKDNWLRGGDDISLTAKNHTFKGANGEKSEKFMQSKYISGKAYDGDGFTAFYTTTYEGYKIKFLLPDEGVNVKDVFTAENLNEINEVSDFNAIDESARKQYFTRCLFPEFKAGYDNNLKKVLSQMGITDLFTTDCDMSGLIDASFASPVFCPEVRHVATLSVDRKGIEGAAVTVIAGDGSAAPGEEEFEKVYLDFVVDRTFGFIVTDARDVPLFTGIINGI